MTHYHPSATIRHRTATDRVKAGHPEAIAVRRLVVARGAWLSPLYATYPMPELTPWEASCDLLSALNTWLTHETKRARDREANTRNGGARCHSHETPTLREIQAIRLHGKQDAAGRFTKAEPLAVPTVASAAAPILLAPVKAKGWVSLKEATPRHSTRKTPPPRHALTEDERLAAVERIVAIAAENTAKARELEAKKAAVDANREARRKQTAKAANVAHTKRIAERVVKDAAYAEAYRAKRRAQEHARNAEGRAARAARKAANQTPEAISDRKTKEYQRRKALTLARVAADPAYAAKLKAKAQAIEKKRCARNRAAKAEAAKAKLQEMAESIAAEARAKRKARSNAKQAARQAITSGDAK